jgi:hypothetical protein
MITTVLALALPAKAAPRAMANDSTPGLSLTAQLRLADTYVVPHKPNDASRTI